jgi:hypothetical protein
LKAVRVIHAILNGPAALLVPAFPVRLIDLPGLSLLKR